MMELSLVIAILVSHYISDFLFQSDNMAINKSTSNKWLLTHTGTYSIMLSILLGIFIFVFYNITINFVFFIVVTFVAHTITDYITSRKLSVKWEQNKFGLFFNLLGFDQLLHFIQLMLTAQFLNIIGS